jgi:hypothetical protein
LNSRAFSKGIKSIKNTIAIDIIAKIGTIRELKGKTVTI